MMRPLPRGEGGLMTLLTPVDISGVIYPLFSRLIYRCRLIVLIRTNAEQEFNHGVVLSRDPLHEGQTFEVWEDC